MGRGVLVNAVLDTILVYLMSAMQLPPSVLQLMDKKRRAFLWSGDKDGKSSPAACLVAWINVCKPRDVGGLGIRNFGIQNVCLLLKLLHRLHCPDSSVWARWVQRRASIIYMSGEILGDHWQVIKSLLPLYQAITSVKIGNGNSCSFWSDAWIAGEALEDQYPALFSHCTDKKATVNDVVTNGLSLVPRLSHQAAGQRDALLLTLQSVTLSDEPDKRTSPFSKGENCLDSGAIYRMLMARGQESDPRSQFIWKNCTPPRVQFFMWLLIQGKFQTRSVLFKKNVVQDTACEICNEDEESSEHIMWGCTVSKVVWTRLGFHSINSMELNSLHTIPCPAVVEHSEPSMFLAIVCWNIWKARNAKIFRNLPISTIRSYWLAGMMLSNGDVASLSLKGTWLTPGVPPSTWLETESAKTLLTPP